MTNSTSVAAISIDNAPLEVDKLKNIGRYQLRRLAEALTALKPPHRPIPILDTEAKKSAFMTGTIEAMADAVFSGLKLYRSGEAVESSDKEVSLVPGPTASSATAAETPVEASKSEEPEKPKRTPKTAATTNGASNGVASVDSSQVVASAIVALKDQLAKHHTSLETALTAQVTSLAGLTARVTVLEGMMKAIFGAVLLDGENALNVSQSQLLEDALEVADTFKKKFLPKEAD